MDSAPVTEIQVKSHCEAITMTVIAVSEGSGVGEASTYASIFGSNSKGRDDQKREWV